MTELLADLTFDLAKLDPLMRVSPMVSATWRKPRGIRLTPTSRYIRDKLFPKR